MDLSQALYTFRRIAMPSVPGVDWAWANDKTGRRVATDHVMISISSVSTNKNAEQIDCDGELKIKDRVSVSLKVMIVDKDSFSSIEKSRRLVRLLRSYDARMEASRLGVAVSFVGDAFLTALPDYSDGEASFRNTAVVAVRISYTESYGDDQGRIDGASIPGSVGGVDVTVKTND